MCVRACVHVCLCACVRACVHECMHECVCVHACTYIYGDLFQFQCSLMSDGKVSIISPNNCYPSVAQEVILLWGGTKISQINMHYYITLCVIIV